MKTWTVSRHLPKQTIQMGYKRIKRQVIIVETENNYLVGIARVDRKLQTFYKQYDGYKTWGVWMTGRYNTPKE